MLFLCPKVEEVRTISDGRIIIDTQINSSGAESGIKSLGSMASSGLSGIASAGKAMGVAIAGATVAVGGLVKASIEQYSQFEQLTGGVETLFKASSGTVMEYANNAYKTAGMSANEYMSTITGFSASLLQGLGGDTAKAAEVGNMAVTDMSDNAAKMGTSMESIQNTYQGFAKQNYTMLDNLKLGYGGTKTEMERLLVDAGKISGMKYDMSKFSDVIDAIHVVQTEMGITGTTAKEASGTIEGSLNMTKSAWKNLLTGMADDNANFDTLINNLVDSVGAFGDNVLPRIEIALNGVAQLIEKLLPPIMEKIPTLIMNILPGLITTGMQIIQNLITGIQTSLPTIMVTVISIVTTLITGFIQVLPQLLTIGMQIIAQLVIGIAQALPTLIPMAVQCIADLVKGLYDNLPMIIEAGMQLLKGLADGIINSIPILVEMLPQIIDSMITYITTALPMILETGLTILLALIDGLVKCLPQLIAMLPKIIESIVTFITNNLPQIIDTGIKVLLALISGLVNALPQLITMIPQITQTIINTLIAHLPEIVAAAIQIMIALIGGLIQAIPQLIAAIPQIITAIVSTFGKTNWGDIGINIMKGIGEGISKGISGILSKASDAVQKIKDKFTGITGFDIHSPSRWGRNMVGKNIPKGIGLGFEDETPNLLNNADSMVRELKTSMDFNTARTTTNIVGSANKAANIANSTTTVTESDNGPKVYIEHFHGTDESNITQLAQEIAFLDKRKPN